MDQNGHMFPIEKVIKMKLSIVIPCFNQCRTINEILSRVENCAHQPKEIIIVDEQIARRAISARGHFAIQKRLSITSESRERRGCENWYCRRERRHNHYSRR